MGPGFFQTMMGRKLFDAQLPELLKQLKRIADELQRYNDREESKESG